jgi:hypothetical protein
LRAPLDTQVHLLHRSSSLTERRSNGQSLRLKNVDDDLEQRDELRHAARWWLAAARAMPGTPLAAKARWKALETMPKIARASAYAEDRAREIKGETVSREIYARLRQECPGSVEAQRLAAYWNFPPPVEGGDESLESFELRDAHLMGYPLDDDAAFLPPNDDQNSEASEPYYDALKRSALLPEKAGSVEPPEFAREVRELDDIARKHVTSITDATLGNFLDDLVSFCSEPNVTREMQATYCAIRYDVLQSNGWDRPGTGEPVIKKDDEIRAEIEQALKDPAMQRVADYLEFSRIGLISGDRTQVETDVVDPKGDGEKVSVTSRDYAEMEEMTRAFLQKYPRSHKREAALFVLARSIQALSRPQIFAIGIVAPGTTPADDVFDVVDNSYQAEAFNPKRVLAALDDYDREYPKGRYAAEVRNLRGMTLWRTHDWGRALDLTIAQLDDHSKQDLRPEASVRLANIFANLDQSEFRHDLLEAIRARSGAIKYLKLFLARVANDRSHPLRYLQAYLSDQLNLGSIAND